MRLRVMTDQDVQAGLRLNTLAGWNQTSADWQLFLKQSPDGCFVAEVDGKVIGTAATIPYENRFAWIGMVLVDPEFRKAGIGTQLLHKTIEHLDQAGISSMKLDATPLGKPLYEKLGFVMEYEIERWILKRSPGETSPPNSPETQCIKQEQLSSILVLDRELFGADRGFLLRSLSEHAPEFALTVASNSQPQAYAFGRHGLFADHLGPWMANSRASAEAILQSFLADSKRETLIVDCMKSNTSATELFSAFGFTISRPLTRMVRGPNAYPGRPSQLCAILGPEFG
jgi:GNAT superfamily N-acetyltransferase